MMKRQKGAVMVEYALISLLFIAMLFIVIEIGRWLFIWETLNEATRRGARIAAVCPINHSYISTATVFGDPTDTDGQTSPILPGLSTDDVTVTYYTIDGGALAQAADPASVETQIAMVKVEVDYSHVFLAPALCMDCEPLFSGGIFAPKFSTLIPVESLGDLQKEPNYCY
jgi:hypothetical protein